MDFLSELRARLKPVLQQWITDESLLPQYLEMVRPAQDTKFGDFQANCAMPLAALLKRDKRAVAADIVAHWNVADLCEQPEIAGPGFINLRILQQRLLAETQQLLTSSQLGVVPAKNPCKIVIDYSSPNVAKPMHVGHLRSSVIGNALTNILKYAGHHVITDNHVGDWGTQFGMILYGYKHFLDAAAYQQNQVQELARLYRLVNQLSECAELQKKLPQMEAELTRLEEESRRAQAEFTAQPADKNLEQRAKKAALAVVQVRQDIDSAMKKVLKVGDSPQLSRLYSKHPEIDKLARLETAKLHAGDAENLKLWQEFLPICLNALQQVYQRMGISFDYTLGESFYQPRLQELVERLLSEQIAEVSQGAVCIFHPEQPAPFIIRKSDGAFTYGTTDLATIEYRLQKFQADTILYVVDSRQSEHFQALFATARKIGYTQIKLKHVQFGTVNGADGKPLKTREGDLIGLESLFDEAVQRASTIVNENSPDLELTSREDVAEIIGMGGVYYADLRTNRDSDYKFDWDRMLSKTGDTATYIQYANARVQGIFRKADVSNTTVQNHAAALILETDYERKLAMQLNGFATAIADVQYDDRPHILAQYLYQTATVFAQFFDNCHVLKADTDELKWSRLKLCDLTGRILTQGLLLLGIHVPERM